MKIKGYSKIAYDFTRSSMFENVQFLHDLTLLIHQNTSRNRIVELGTYYGCSFFAFAEAASRLGNIELIGVDTWKGDEHTGMYGEEVYNEFKKGLSEYPDFTSAIRDTFDNAVKQFDDSSIDVLLIDGLHHQDAVKHDFETWVGKVKPSGFVLLHDTCVERFGVKDFLKELQLDERYEVFNFNNVNGLGVITRKGNPRLKTIKALLSNPKVAVYTAIIGGKDELKPQVPQNIPVDFIAFTDGQRHDQWSTQVVGDDLNDARLSAKQYKILAYKYLSSYDYSIWIDGNVEITDKNFVNQIISDLKNADIALLNHPDRIKVIDEYYACIAQNRMDNREKALRWINEHYAQNNRLYAGSIIGRNHSSNMQKFNDQWWKYIQECSIRDQLTLPSALQYLNAIALIGGYLFNHSQFNYHPHAQ